MNPKLVLKLVIDIGMTVVLLLLMTYEMIGRLAAFLIAGYGICAFIKREIGSYMLLKSHFVFFDYEEPLIFFLLDYMAVMGLFVLLGHYFCEGLKRIDRRQKKQ